MTQCKHEFDPAKGKPTATIKNHTPNPFGTGLAFESIPCPDCLERWGEYMGKMYEVQKERYKELERADRKLLEDYSQLQAENERLREQVNYYKQEVKTIIKTEGLWE